MTTINLDHLHEVAVAADTAPLDEEFLPLRQKAWEEWLEAMDPATFLALEPVLRAAAEWVNSRPVDRGADQRLVDAVREAGLS